MICLRCYITGDVQGVFYRASARHEAERYGVLGYARNLPDGRVEVLACGAKPSVEEFCAWLSKGPSQARVNNVTCESVDEVPPADFIIG